MNEAAQIFDKEFLQFFFSLVELHNNLPKKEEESCWWINKCFYDEYMTHLKFFEKKTGESLSHFEIPSSAISHRSTDNHYYCEKHILRQKIGALVNYLNQMYLPHEEDRRIGFSLN